MPRRPAPLGGGGAPSSSSSHPAFPTRRAPYALPTESTAAQEDAEDECSPFLIDLTSLSRGELDHLRGVGLLPPLPRGWDDGGDIGGRSGSGGGGGRRGGRGDKASRLLGDGPSIEALDGGDDGSGGNGGDDGDDGARSDRSEAPFDQYAVRLLRARHVAYLSRALRDPLPRGFVSLDSSRPWMVYWCLHSLDLMGYFDVGEDGGDGLGGSDAMEYAEVVQKGHLLERIVSTLDRCWTTVPLEFDASEVESDWRLKRLRREQNGDKEQTDDSRPSPTTTGQVRLTGGGFGGGPGQMPHCAPTYAAVLSLCVVAGVGSNRPEGHPYSHPGKMALTLLERRRMGLYAHFLTLRVPQQGGDRGDKEEERTVAFRMHRDGEVDVRASYCLLAPCYLLGMLQEEGEGGATDGGDDGDVGTDAGRSRKSPLASPAAIRHVAACQTFEGGFGAEPSNEAHGGYTFCALAALRLLDAVDAIDADALGGWLARRQTGYEGGFCGRTNKLVDGCYSFWQGGATAVLDGWLRERRRGGDGDDDGDRDDESWSFDEVMLQRYILLCAQDVHGGLRDKPSKPKDFYHSCYNLSGLSVAQHAPRPWPPSTNRTKVDAGEGKEGASKEEEEEKEKFNRLFGDASVNVLGRTDPVINIRVERVEFMLAHRFDA